MRAFHQLLATAVFFAAASIFIASSGAQSVAGKTSVTSLGDTIQFNGNGTATERNGRLPLFYKGQTVDMGDGSDPHTACDYSQDGNIITLTCGFKDQPGDNVKAVFTVNGDGSLTGPPTGMWGQKSFAHLVPK